MLLNYRSPLKGFIPIIGAGTELSFNFRSRTYYNVLAMSEGSDVTNYQVLESKLQTWQKPGYLIDIGGEIKLNHQYSLVTKLRFQSFGTIKESEESRYPNMIFEELGGNIFRTNSAVFILGLAF
jgi:hypothetical protein